MSASEDRTALDWEARFRDNETPWERGDLHPAIALWQQAGALEAGRRIIVPGCGRSPEPAFFAGLGLEVTAMDLSGTAIAWQKAHFDQLGLSGHFVEGDSLAWTPDEPVDLVHEQTFLCAIHPSLRTDYEAALRRWLKPGGQLLALFMQKDEMGGPPYGCSLDAMRSLFPADRWDWPSDTDFRPCPHPSLNGKPELAGILTLRAS